MARFQGFIAGLAFSALVCAAQAPATKDSALNDIARRAQDPNHPQSPEVTNRELKAWADTWHGTIDNRTIDLPASVKGSGTIANPMRLCQSDKRCTLISAQQSGSGKMTCTYACK